MITILQRGLRLMRMAWVMRRIRKAETQAIQQTAQRALSELLADARGLPMKVGQFLAGMDDNNSYSKLTSSVEPWSLKHIKPILEQAWQQPLQFTLKNIDESCAAASLGQVHKAYLSDKECVAVKVQYPDIATAIDAEMKLAGLMPAGGPVKTWSFDLNNYKQTLRDNLHNELDYLHEMKQQLQFSSTISVTGLRVPHVFPILCRRNVLVQEWMDGVRLSETVRWPLQARLYIARTLIQTMFQSIFQLGLIHGDPHPGNLLFQHHDTQPQTILLDFGCMIHIEKTRRLALLKLILYSRGECKCGLLDIFIALGFHAGKLTLIEAKLPLLVQILFQPFVETRPFDTTAWHVSDTVANLLGDQRWWFRSAAPADLFLLIRVFQGLTSQLETLQVQLPWWPLLKQAIQESTLEESKRWQANITSLPEEEKYKCTAKKLLIHIQLENKKPIHITLPAYQALDLESLVPEHIHQHIQDTDIHFKKIHQQLITQGLEPQTLIDINYNNAHYHIYLE